MTTPVRNDRDAMEYDVVIVGGGPAGLSCAIRLKQLAKETGAELSVCVLEKGSEIGAHLLSGAVFDPRALNELIPDWADKGAPLTTKAKTDEFVFLTARGCLPLPTPPQMKNHGHYIISLGAFARWLAEQAEAEGVEIFAGFAAAEILYTDQNQVIGVATGDMGLDRQGQKTDQFEPGVELHARQTVFAEGCHGSLTKQLIEKYNLRANACAQTYALGVKELWEVKTEHHRPGHVLHTLGWPMDSKTYGGSWMYHMENNTVSIGFVTGLDYHNPYLSPYEEMQRFKLHPKIRSVLEGGRRIAYGARALVEGGLQSLPKLTFPGGVLTGDTAGFLNVSKIKGNHTAMKSGMIAAESVFSCMACQPENGKGWECASYAKNYKSSWLYRELYRARNIRPGFRAGMWAGLIHAAFQTYGGWMIPYTLKNHADYLQLQTADACAPIPYPKPDGVLTFDRLSSVQLSNTYHEENQPVHLKLKDPDVPVAVNLTRFAGPAQRYCPAGVYEFIEEGGDTKFIINAQNCIHCKTCDIKDPSQNIIWTTPQGGGGPNYPNM